MIARGLLRGAAAVGLATAAFVAAGCGGPKRRDVIVVTLDTVRADRLGCYGRKEAETPNIDALAAGSVLFEDASCATPITLPSHATLFTGRYPSSTGVRNNGSFVLPASETTLAETLHDAGWSTAAVIAAFPLQSRYGLAQGFDVYDDELPPLRAAPGDAFPIRFSERDARAVTDRALVVWKHMKRGPRFLWVHYFDAHAPYLPPEPYRSRLASPYEGEIAYVDAELGRLLDRLRHDAPGAIIVVAADHGESLGEHGEKTHGIFLYQSTVHVPLIIRAPGLWPEGRRIGGPVSLADVMPTILGLVKVRPEAPMDGGDLGPWVTGRGPAPRREVYAESYLPRLEFRFSPLTMLRSGSMKYIDAPEPEVYDLSTDPGESRNLAGRSARQAELADRLRAFVARSDQNASARAAGSLDSEAEARLRSLGYAAAGTLDTRPGERGRDPKTMTDYLARYDRAAGLVATGKTEEGIAELRRLIPEAPENYMARYQLAAGLLAAGRVEEAAGELGKVLATEPEFANGWLMRADCEAKLGHLDDAVRDYDRAAELLPGHAEPKLALGRTLESRGRFARAAEAYRAAIAIEPSAAGPASALLALRAGRGDLQAAVTELHDLSTRYPRSAALATVYADALFRMGKPKKALDEVEAALRMDPARSDAHLLKGMLLLRGGDPAEAAKAFRSVLAHNVGSKAAAYGLGRALIVSGQESEARAWIERLRGQYPQDAEPWVLSGRLAERTGKPEAAAAAYRSALAIDPRNGEARKRLQGLGAP